MFGDVGSNGCWLCICFIYYEIIYMLIYGKMLFLIYFGNLKESGKMLIYIGFIWL